MKDLIKNLPPIIIMLTWLYASEQFRRYVVVGIIVISPLIPFIMIGMAGSGKFCLFKDRDEMKEIIGSTLLTLFVISVVAFLGALLIHPGVGIVIMGGWLLIYFFQIIKDTYEANNQFVSSSIIAFTCKMVFLPWFVGVFFADLQDGTNTFNKYCQSPEYSFFDGNNWQN